MEVNERFFWERWKWDVSLLTFTKGGRHFSSIIHFEMQNVTKKNVKWRGGKGKVEEEDEERKKERQLIGLLIGKEKLD